MVHALDALTVKLLVHLSEVDSRKLYRERAFSSMFDYCVAGLAMSDGEAYLRILVARNVRQFPLILERLAAGAVSLSVIKVLSPHLTAENHVQLLDRVRGMSKRKVEVLVAELAPKPDVPAQMRKVPERAQRTVRTAAITSATCSALFTAVESNTATATSMQGPDAVASAFEAQPSAAQASSAMFALQPPRPRAKLNPLSPRRFELRLTVRQDVHDALEQLVELLRHQNPSGDMTSIVERAVCALLKREMKRRFGQTEAKQPQAKSEPAPVATRVQMECENPKVTAPKSEPAPAARLVETRTECPVTTRGEARSPMSRYIPVAVRRDVYARDDGQCTFVSADGRRCTERGFLEVHHHHTTFARRGAATVGNLRIACRAHNALYAELDYGRELMQQKLREAAAGKRL